MAAQFWLRPCKVVANKIAETNEEPITLEWSALRAKLAPSQSKQALLTLRTMKTGCYLGLIQHPTTAAPTTFRLDLPAGSTNISWLLKKDRTVASRIMEIYLVQNIQWDDRTEESTEGTFDE